MENEQRNPESGLERLHQDLVLVKEAVDSGIDATQEVSDGVGELTKALREQTEVLKQILAALSGPPAGPPVALKITTISIT